MEEPVKPSVGRWPCHEMNQPAATLFQGDHRNPSRVVNRTHSQARHKDYADSAATLAGRHCLLVHDGRPRERFIRASERHSLFPSRGARTFRCPSFGGFLCGLDAFSANPTATRACGPPATDGATI